MPSLTLAFAPEGPILQILVYASAPRRAALKAAGMPIPKPISINVLVDTGASSTCVDSSQLAKLGIPPSGLIDVHTPSTGSTPVQLSQFDVDLGVVLDNGKFHLISTLPVIESNFVSPGVDGLLGRDVLSQGILIFNGSAKTFTLAF